MKKNTAFIGSGIVFVVFVGALTFLFLAVAAPRKNFDRFLKEIATLEIGKTTLEQFRGQVARAHVSDTIYRVSFPCEPQNCGVSLRSENRLLHKLRLAPLSTAIAGVGFTDHIVSDIYIILATQATNDGGVKHDDKGVVVRLTSEQPLDCHTHYDSSVKLRTGTAERYWGTVHMDHCVSREDLVKAVAINSGCLTRIGGCQSPDKFLPQVFERTR